MAGLEVLFAVAKEHITSQNDALVCCLHWNMIASGYRCIGSGEEVSSRNDMAVNSVNLIKNYSKRLYHAGCRSTGGSQQKNHFIIQIMGVCMYYVARMFYIENEVRVGSAIVKYRDFIGILIKAKIMGLLTPGTVNLTAKYHINVCL